MALFMMFQYKFYGGYDIPWVDLIWNNCYASSQIPYCTSREVHSGGRTSLGYLINLGQSLCPLLVMARLSSFGKIFGIILCPSVNFPVFILFAKNKDCPLPNSLKIWT